MVQIQRRIDLLRETLFDAAEGAPKKLTFYENQNSSLKGFTEASFIISGKNVVYNNRLKMIDRMLLGYLQETVDIGVESIDRQPWQTAIMVDIQLLIWNSLLHLSEYEAQSLFVGQDSLQVTRAETKHNILDLANRDQSDNMVFYYFYYRPKTIGNFQSEYPANQITFYRSLLRLAVGGYLRISDSKGTVRGTGASAEAHFTGAQQAPPVTKKVSGLKKILNAIKNL